MAIIGFILCFLLLCYFTFAGVVMVIYSGIWYDMSKRMSCCIVVGLSVLWWLLISNAPFTVSVGG